MSSEIPIKCKKKAHFKSKTEPIKSSANKFMSRLTDSNCLPARYECAALPGELSRQKFQILIRDLQRAHLHVYHKFFAFH